MPVEGTVGGRPSRRWRDYARKTLCTVGRRLSCWDGKNRHWGHTSVTYAGWRRSSSGSHVMPRSGSWSRPYWSAPDWGSSESTIKGIISAAIMATEVRLVDACIPTTIWRSVKAAKKTRNAAKERIWGSPIILLHMAARTSSLEDWAVVGLAIVLFQLFLRVGEAVTLQPWAVVDDAVRFFDSKTRQDWQQRSLTPLTREWLQWLQRHFPEPAAEGRRPWTTQQLEKGMQRLLVGSPFEGARRHAWRRAGARAMWTAGATIRQVAVWGRWARDSTARWYAHPTETQPVQAEDFWPRPP